MKRISFETVRSNETKIGTQSIQIESKRLIIPFPNGGFAFQTPTAVYNTQTDERLPILDTTRISILTLFTVGLLISMFHTNIIKRKNSDERK